MSLQLLCVNTGIFSDALAVIRHCIELKWFDEVTIIHPQPIAVESINVVKSTGKTMTECWMKDVPAAVKCDHVLSVQWDGFIINPGMWKDAWLQYDWIGSPWKLKNIPNPKWRVGSGGFCLFSRQMAQAWPTICNTTENHDWQVGALYRDRFEAQGMKYAPLMEALQFSKECDLEDIDVAEGSTFGFHGFQYAKERHLFRKRLTGVPQAK